MSKFLPSTSKLRQVFARPRGQGAYAEASSHNLPQTTQSHLQMPVNSFILMWMVSISTVVGSLPSHSSANITWRYPGCPQPWAYSEHVGSWLLRQPDRVRDLVRAAKDRLGWSYPVSIKVRVDSDLQYVLILNRNNIFLRYLYADKHSS
jgi:hypothetical protein